MRRQWWWRWLSLAWRGWCFCCCHRHFRRRGAQQRSSPAKTTVLIGALEAGRCVVAELLLLLLCRRSGWSRCTRRRLLDAAPSAAAAAPPVLSILCPPSLLAGGLADCSAAAACGWHFSERTLAFENHKKAQNRDFKKEPVETSQAEKGRDGPTRCFSSFFSFFPPQLPVFCLCLPAALWLVCVLRSCQLLFANESSQ